MSKLVYKANNMQTELNDTDLGCGGLNSWVTGLCVS